MEENPDHIISWENIAFVDQESNWSRRKIKESIYINAMDPSQKPTQIMSSNLQKRCPRNKTSEVNQFRWTAETCKRAQDMLGDGIFMNDRRA